MLDERMERFRQRDQERARLAGMDLRAPHAPYTLTFSGITICHVCTQAKKQSTKWWQWWKNWQVEWPCEFANQRWRQYDTEIPSHEHTTEASSNRGRMPDTDRACSTITRRGHDTVRTDGLRPHQTGGTHGND